MLLNSALQHILNRICGAEGCCKVKSCAAVFLFQGGCPSAIAVRERMICTHLKKTINAFKATLLMHSYVV